MSAKHQPGPWVIDHADNLIHASDDRKTLICNLGANLKNPAVMADARLIASAPDLLEALREAENALADYIPTIEKSGASLNYGHKVLRQCRAAIKLATGSTT